MTPTIEWVERCASTNALMHARAAGAPAGLVLVAREQTAGRGQRGNTWEAEPGMNLTFSILLRPSNIPAARQFELSMLVALAVADTIEIQLAGCASAAQVRVKWPNDIYVGNSKVCGMLLENSLSGSSIVHSIAGVGLNVNQTRFVSDAPNPVSLAMLTGRHYELEPLMTALAARICAAVDAYPGTSGPAADLLAQYSRRLWHGNGNYRFREPGGDVFTARITGVGADGLLSLSNGRSYAFKEIEQLLI